MRSRRACARRTLLALALAASAWLVIPARAADDGTPIPEARGYVNDVAGILGATRSAQLESYLDQLHAKAGVQFAVLTVDSTGVDGVDRYKERVFKAWGIGGSEKDEGLLLLVAMRERALKFETGYGLEGTLPDGWQAGMLRELVVPRFRAGEYADGVTLAVLASADRIAKEKGITLAWTGDALRYDRTSRRGRRGLPPIVLAFVLFLVISSLLRRVGGGRGGFFGGAGPWIGGGLGGWGGGFGGGGGGGGGGSSFGGFGGGGSGGGGGGASW